MPEPDGLTLDEAESRAPLRLRARCGGRRRVDRRDSGHGRRATDEARGRARPLRPRSARKPEAPRLVAWPKAASTSRSRQRTSLARTRRASDTRTRAPRAGRTIATTSSSPALRVCRAVRPSLPDARARAHCVARRPGELRGGGGGRALGGSARVLRPSPLSRAARRGGARDGAR